MNAQINPDIINAIKRQSKHIAAKLDSEQLTAILEAERNVRVLRNQLLAAKQLADTTVTNVLQEHIL